MPSVKYIEQPQAGTPTAEVYAAAKNYFGHVPNLVKALGSNESMCISITNFLIESLGEGRVNWAFKELIILKTLRVMKSFYSYGAHERLALELGVSEEKLSDIANSLWKNSPYFSEKEKLVFELIEQIGIDANDVKKELWDKLKQHWNNGQLVEINSVVTTFLMIGRLGDALGIVEPRLFSEAI